jgi:aspartyl-tRNA(Asn)/glutamyl-tRNA(Gln) amidotransferase subunit A
MEWHQKSVDELAEALANGSVSSTDLTRHFVERTRRLEPQLNAFLSFDEEKTFSQAEASDQRRRSGKTLGPLDGIPVGLKDIVAEKGQPLTAGSRMLENFRSPYDATVVDRLKRAGMVLWGRLNMDEFAMGSSSENSAFGPTSNPWDLGRIPGGSSSGSAAAISAGEVPLALGSDTGGSVRQPAALCGIVGLKPTYGRVSRYGLVAYASSLDQIGPMGRCVRDVAHLLSVMAGHDPKDSTSSRQPVPDYTKAIDSMAGRRYRMGIPKEYFGEGLDDEVRRSIEEAIGFYRNEGWEIRDVSIPTLPYSVPVYYVVATAEASSNLARYDGIRYTHRSPSASSIDEVYDLSRQEGFGPEVKRRILLGTYVLSHGYYDAFYGRAQRLRTLMYRDFSRVFGEVDLLLTPTSPFPAFRRGEKINDPLAMYLSDVYTISANLAGLPALSIPCGFTAGGLPIGLQLIGRAFGETDVLSAAHTFERAHRWNRFPPMA